jgi:uncharacterized protein DUF4328
MNSNDQKLKYRPAPILAVLTVSGLMIFMLLDLMLVPSGLIGMYGAGVFTGEPRDEGVIELAFLIRGLSALGQMVMFLFTSTVFCMLMYRCAKNARALGFSGFQHSVGWVAGWFFVPFAHLWMPYKAVGEVWQTSLVDPEEVPSTDWQFNDVGIMFNAWWATWIFGTIISNIASRMSRSVSVDIENFGLCVTPFSAILQAASGLLCILMVLKITKRQDRQFRVVFGYESISPGGNDNV